jgi:hypothetical protein
MFGLLDVRFGRFLQGQRAKLNGPQSNFRGGTPYSHCRKWNDVLTAIDNGEKLHKPATMSR